MKRLLSGVLVLLLCLCGCGKTVPEERTEPTVGQRTGVTVSALETAADLGAFSAEVPEPEEARAAKELVEAVLEQYPAGFADQWGEVQILLTAELTGTDAFSGGSYAGFTQRLESGWLMVLDVRRCDAGTVHHEIAHILDGILTEAGLLREEEWMAFCPDGFAYGQTDFERYADFFTDGYAMGNMKEDRAGVFEQAVLGGPGAYADRPALWLKLEYFSRAIRTHFDTTGWPVLTIWELALE